MLKDPSQANLDALDAALAALETRVTTLLERQAVQNPGELVVMDSDQLDGVQNLVAALRNLGFVLPLLVLLLYLARPLPGEGMAPASADRRRWRDPGGDAARPAGEAPDRHAKSWIRWRAPTRSSRPSSPSGTSFPRGFASGRCSSSSSDWRSSAPAGWRAPGASPSRVRRFLAPYLRDHPVAVYSVVAVLFLLWLAFIPGIDNLGQILVIVLLAVLAMVGSSDLAPTDG